MSDKKQISVVHATRRPEKALAIRRLWLHRASDPSRVKWTFGIDDDDAKSLAALKEEPHNISAAGGGCIRAYNETASKFPGDIYVCASDDVYPFQDWDRVIEERLGDLDSPKFLGCSDGHNGAVPIQIVSRGWVHHFGFIFHPAFKSMYGDNWMEGRARTDGFFIPAKDIVFEHKHPLFGKGEWDDVYTQENSKDKYDEGLKTFSELFEPMPISLCMICGNEEKVILQCLESAKTCFEQLCLVRAIGDHTPDGTLDIAGKWCSENGKDFICAEYKNAIPMPHVDNFAAARNLSFSLATHEWILWLDCDDYLDAINCLRIKEATKGACFDALSCRYKVEKEGAEIYRERLIRNGKGTWTKAIHETCEIRGGTWTNHQIVVYHSDHRLKHKSSAERNERILSGVVKDAPRHYFYLHSELKILGKHEEARRAANAALAMIEGNPEFSDNNPEYTYLLHLNLSELEPEKTIYHLHEAIKIQPHRREAYAYLSQKGLIDGDMNAAQSYFRVMDALPEPSPLPWTHQGIWYSWARNYLLVKILRATGYADKAKKLHAEYLQNPDYAEGVKEHEQYK